MKPKFFPSPSAWHARLEEHHEEKEETRLKRLDQLIEDSENDRTIRELRRPVGKK